MDAIQMIKERRSIRKYTDKIVDEATLKEIIEVAKYAPSWANFQVARYHFIQDPKIIAEISENGVNGFVYNQNTLKNTHNLLVLTFVQGKSGRLDPTKDEYATNKGNVWEMFDAGIACQTFCLAAHEKGIGTCIFGVFDDKAVSQILNLPAEETVAAVITYGYPDEEVKATPRKDISEIMSIR